MGWTLLELLKFYKEDTMGRRWTLPITLGYTYYRNRGV